MSRKFNIKKRFVSVLMALLMALTIVPTMTAHAATYNGGGGYAASKLTVYKSVNGSSYGTIYKGEGFTILNFLSGDWLYVEYSTSNGPKRGYVKRSNGNVGQYDPSCVAKVTKDSSLYYGNSTSKYPKSGTVYEDEIVSVLAKSGSWVYVEYNTNAGRKRGYMLNANLSYYNYKTMDPLLVSKSETPEKISGSFDVYSGPSNQYPVIGSISNEKIEYLDTIHEGTKVIYYIRYNVTGTSQKKTGFIIIG